MKIFQNFFKNGFPMLILVGIDTLYVKKNSKSISKKVKNVQKRVQTKNAPLFDEKCQFRVPNFHLVEIHVQKTMHLRETRGGVDSSPVVRY